MKYGLSQKQLDEIVRVLSSYGDIEEAILFGSRALNDHKEGSDVDMTIKGKNVTWRLACKVQFTLEEETDLPFFFDVVAYSTITSEELKQHIQHQGKILYKKSR